MIVYVETNFLFEFGLGRAQQESCRVLVAWCQAGRIELRLPAFAVPETLAALRRRERARQDLILGLKRQQSDARRHSADPTAYATAEEGLQAWTRREGGEVDRLTRELFGTAKFLPLDFDTLGTSYLLRDLKVIPGDADLFILGSIVQDLDRRRAAGDTAPSLFISGDKDFADADARHWLRPYSCDLLTSYSAAVARLKGQTS